MTLNKILRWIVAIGVFAIPAVIPFIVTGSMFFPFITGKAFAFRIIVEIIFGAWLLLALCDKNYRPKFSWILGALGVFLFVILLADIFAENPLKAFWSNFERMEGFVSLFHMALYFLVAGATLINEKFWNWTNFFRLNILTSIVMSSYGFLQLAGKITINQGGVRLDGTFGNATYLAGYMLMMIFLALFLFSKENNKWWKGIYSVTIIFNLIILYSTATRGALLGLIGGLILTAVIIAIFEKQNKTLRKISIGVAVAVIALSGIFFAIRNTDFVQSRPSLARLTSISASNSDAQARFMVWNMAWQGFKERPILGWGQEGFNFVFNKYYNPDMYGREQWFDRTHSILFDWLVAGGILGFLGYYSILVMAFLYIWGFKKIPDSKFNFSVTEKALLTGLLAAYWFQNVFVFDNVVSYILFFSFLAYLHSDRSINIKKIESLPEPKKSEVIQFYAPITIIVLVVIIWFVNVKNISAAKDLLKALSPQPKGITENINYFKSAINRNSFGVQEIREQLVQAATNIISSKNPAITEDMKSQFLALSINEIKKQITAVPNDARNHIFLASLYSSIGSTSEAISSFESALKLSPAKQIIKISLASSYLQANEKQKALEVMKSAYESAPEVSETALIYAVTMIYNKDLIGAEALLKNTFGDDTPADLRLIQSYLQNNYFEKAIVLAKKAV
ncbi:MAG TPA: O-antigen ligase family protein, partial [Candidatus Paceibacterota bacterium]